MSTRINFFVNGMILNESAFKSSGGRMNGCLSL